MSIYTVYHVHCEQVTLVFSGECGVCGTILDEADHNEVGDPIIRGTVMEVVESGPPICPKCEEDLDLHEMVEVEEIVGMP